MSVAMGLECEFHDDGNLLGTMGSSSAAAAQRRARGTSDSTRSCLHRQLIEPGIERQGRLEVGLQVAHRQHYRGRLHMNPLGAQGVTQQPERRRN
jgi:hypothetical protein